MGHCASQLSIIIGQIFWHANFLLLLHLLQKVYGLVGSLFENRVVIALGTIRWLTCGTPQVPWKTIEKLRATFNPLLIGEDVQVNLLLNSNINA